MDNLIKLAGWILPEPGRTGSLRVATIGMTAVALCAGLAAVMILAALGYVATAFWLLARSYFGHVGALLVILLTGILIPIAWLIMRYRRSAAATGARLLLSEVTRFFNEHGRKP